MPLRELGDETAVVGIEDGRAMVLASDCHRFSATVYLSTRHDESQRDDDEDDPASGPTNNKTSGLSREVGTDARTRPLSPWEEAVAVAAARAGLDDLDPMSKQALRIAGDFLVELWDWANFHGLDPGNHSVAMMFHDVELSRCRPKPGLGEFFRQFGVRLHLHEHRNDEPTHVCTTMGLSRLGAVHDRLANARSGSDGWMFVDPHTCRSS